MTTFGREENCRRVDAEIEQIRQYLEYMLMGFDEEGDTLASLVSQEI